MYTKDNNYIASYLMNSHVTKSNRERSVLFVMCEFFLVFRSD